MFRVWEAWRSRGLDLQAFETGHSFLIKVCSTGGVQGQTKWHAPCS